MNDLNIEQLTEETKKDVERGGGKGFCKIPYRPLRSRKCIGYSGFDS